MEKSLLNQCAILIAIPPDRSQFEVPGRLSDYVRKPLRGRDANIAWRDDYESVACAAQCLIATARRLGVRVYERATLVDLAEASRDCSVVILFAHWRGAKIDASDLSARPEVVSAKLRQHPCFRDSCFEDTNSLVDAMNGTIEDMRLLSELPPSIALTARRSRSIGQTLCRDLLDEYLDGLLTPGNRLEMFDELCSPDQVDRALSADFHGELDLSLCHSEALAVFLDLRRGDRFRHLHWPVLLHPVPQLIKVAAALELFDSEGGSYITKRLSLEEAETSG